MRGLLTVLVISVILLGACAALPTPPAPVETPAPTTPAPAPPKPAWSPTKTITWIVHASPGGGYDTYSRAIARVMAKDLGVDIIIENLPGAGGRRAAIALYNAKPDGYTIEIMGVAGLMALEVTEKPEGYDLDKFTWLGQVQLDPYVISVSPDSQFHTLEDLQKAKEVMFSSRGPGAGGWVASRMPEGVLGIPITSVTGYTGSTECIVAVIRGDVDATVTGAVGTHAPYIEAGDLRPIVILNVEGDSRLPDVPTLKGTGYEEISAVAVTRFVAAPPDTPKEIANVLEEALTKALKNEGLQEWSKKVGRPLGPATGAECSEKLKSLRELMNKYEGCFK